MLNANYMYYVENPRFGLENFCPVHCPSTLKDLHGLKEIAKIS